MGRNRVEWLDVGKFIAISVMIAGHVGLPKAVSDLIHIFHMPIFFIFSGLTFDENKHNSLNKYAVSRVKGLLAPYFIWGGITYIFYSIIPSLQQNGRAVSFKEFTFLLFTQDAENVIFNGFGVIQWFFTSLFISSILAWVIIKICNKVSDKSITKMTAVILLIVGAGILEKMDFPNIIGSSSAVLGCAFFIIGNSFRKYFIEDDVGISVLSKWDKLLFSFLVLMIVYFLNGSTNMRLPRYNNIIMYVIGALAGTCFIIGVSAIVEKYFIRNWLYKAIIYEGQNTVIMLALNRVVQKLMMEKIYAVLLYPVLYNNPIERYVYVIFGIITELILFIPVIYIVNTYLPFSVGRKKYVVKSS